MNNSAFQLVRGPQGDTGATGDSGVQGASGVKGDTGAGGGAYTVSEKTDNYGVQLADVGKTLVMNSSSDKSFTLASVSSGDIGTWYTFVKKGTGRVTITTADSDIIADSSAGGSIYNDESDEIYATITIELVDETQWDIVGGHGVWTTT
ncbi:MAG: collagen-like protein [Proteobacteria bacterium]|nr:collagen-like protein [Pseudomonadota bacterium]